MFLKKNFSDEEEEDAEVDVASFSTVSRSNVDDDTFEPTEENGAVKASTALLLLLLSHRAKVARNAADNFHIMVQVQWGWR